jgi:hypothetical protein
VGSCVHVFIRLDLFFFLSAFFLFAPFEHFPYVIFFVDFMVIFFFSSFTREKLSLVDYSPHYHVFKGVVTLDGSYMIHSSSSSSSFLFISRLKIIKISFSFLSLSSSSSLFCCLADLCVNTAEAAGWRDEEEKHGRRRLGRDTVVSHCLNAGVATAYGDGDVTPSGFTTYSVPARTWTSCTTNFTPAPISLPFTEPSHGPSCWLPATTTRRTQQQQQQQQQQPKSSTNVIQMTNRIFSILG